jgi:hypothetical protein
MKRFHLSIMGLMMLVLLVALGAVALRGGTALWASVTFAAVLALLSTGVLCGIFRRGRAQVGWAGFALFGWPYLIAAFGPGSATNGVTIPPLLPLLLQEPLKKSLAPPGSVTVDGANYPRVSYVDPGPNAETLSDYASVYFLPPDKVPDGWILIATAPATAQGSTPPQRAGSGFGRADMMMPGGDPGPAAMMGMGAGGMMGGTNGAMPAGTPPPPGMASAHPPEISALQVRRVLHCLGAVAFGLIGAGIGLFFVAPPASGRRPDDLPGGRSPADQISQN